MLDWFRDFAETVGLPAHQREAIRDEAAAFLETGTVYVWEDRGDCRAMVSHTPAGLAPGRIRAVYAPPASWARLRERVRVLRLPRAQG